MYDKDPVPSRVSFFPDNKTSFLNSDDNFSDISSLSRIPTSSEISIPIYKQPIPSKRIVMKKRIRSTDLFLSENELKQLKIPSTIENNPPKPTYITPASYKFSENDGHPSEVKPYDMDAQHLDALLADEQKQQKYSVLV